MIKAGRLKKAVAAVLTFAMVAAAGVAGGAKEEVQAKYYTMTPTYDNKTGITWWNTDNNHESMLQGQDLIFHTRYFGKTKLQEMQANFSKLRTRAYKHQLTAAEAAYFNAAPVSDAPVAAGDIVNMHQVTFKLVVTPTFKPSKDLVAKMASANQVGGNFYFAVVDNDSGLEISHLREKVFSASAAVSTAAKNLIASSGMDPYTSLVSVNYLTPWTAHGEKTYWDAAGQSYVKIPKKYVAKIRINYPDGVTGIDIGVGGSTTLSTKTAADIKFWQGTKSFRKTTYGGTSSGYDSSVQKDGYVLYNNTVAHFMRLNPYGYPYQNDANVIWFDNEAQKSQHNTYTGN